VSPGYWAVDLDEDVHLFATAEEARAAAEAALKQAAYGTRTDGEWPETTGAIRWGEVGEGGRRIVREHARFRLDHEHTDACQPTPDDPDDPDGDDPDECTAGYGLLYDLWGKYELVAVGGAS
jgi:hypothetical protein